MTDDDHVSALCDQGEHDHCPAKRCSCSCHVFARRAAKEHIRAMRETLKGEAK